MKVNIMIFFFFAEHLTYWLNDRYREIYSYISQTMWELLGFSQTRDKFLPDFAYITHGYAKEF